MPRRAWLLFTPEMANDLYTYLRDRRTWVVDNALPEGVRMVGEKEARGGAKYLLCEHESFPDVSVSDYPLLPQPRLRKRSEWLREMAAQARTSGPRVTLS